MGQAVGPAVPDEAARGDAVPASYPCLEAAVAGVDVLDLGNVRPNLNTQREQSVLSPSVQSRCSRENTSNLKKSQ